MKKEDLIAMGLTEELAGKVMDSLYGNFVTKARFNEVNEENKALRKSVSDRDKQIDDLKLSAGDNEDLKKQIEQLQADNKAQADAHAKEMQQLRIDAAVEKALTDSGAKNNKAVKALLDIEDAKLDKEGNVKGLQEQIDKLLAADDTKFLFEVPEQSQQQQQIFRGFQPGVSAEQKPGTGVDTTKMNYDELCAYLESNPDAKLE